MEMLKAIRSNDYKKVERKLKKGFNLNQPIEEYKKKDFMCFTIPLCVAAARGCSEIAELLMSYGANIHASNADWSSPMHTATFHGHMDIMRLLLSRCVNVNNRDQHGDTVLHIAVKKSNYEAVTLLIQNNIDLEVKNKKGETALDIAKSLSFTRITQSIEDKSKVIKQANKPKPSPKPAKSINVEETEKERLKRELHEIELKELNDEIKEKRLAVSKVTNEIKDYETETSKIKVNITTLQNKLKDINQTLVSKETLKKRLEQDLEKLVKRKTAAVSNPSDAKEDAFECPICFTLPLPPKHVFQCSNGHIYCNDCKEKPAMKKCPQCRVPLDKENAIRNIMFEDILSTVFT